MYTLSLLFSSLLFVMSCASDSTTLIENETMEASTVNSASIVSVSFNGESGAYTFSVGISSPDTGCEQYANWWEVISEDGSTLIYRRILGHSHVNEQPFTRSGGSVTITEDQVVIVRAHMNTSGYGTTVFKGSVTTGFSQDITVENFASSLATQQPLPSNCAF